MQYKHFDRKPFGTKGDAMAKALGVTFDEFVVKLDKEFFTESGKRNWAHDHLMNNMAAAFQFGLQCLTSNPAAKT